MSAAASEQFGIPMVAGNGVELRQGRSRLSDDPDVTVCHTLVDANQSYTFPRGQWLPSLGEDQQPVIKQGQIAEVAFIGSLAGPHDISLPLDLNNIPQLHDAARVEVVAVGPWAKWAPDSWLLNPVTKDLGILVRSQPIELSEGSHNPITALQGLQNGPIGSQEYHGVIGSAAAEVINLAAQSVVFETEGQEPVAYPVGISPRLAVLGLEKYTQKLKLASAENSIGDIGRGALVPIAFLEMSASAITWHGRNRFMDSNRPQSSYPALLVTTDEQYPFPTAVDEESLTADKHYLAQRLRPFQEKGTYFGPSNLSLPPVPVMPRPMVLPVEQYQQTVQAAATSSSAPAEPAPEYRRVTSAPLPQPGQPVGPGSDILADLPPMPPKPTFGYDGPATPVVNDPIESGPVIDEAALANGSRRKRR